MKIAIVGTAYPYRGGLAAYSERLAQQLILEGHDVTIYTFKMQYPDLIFPGKTQYSESAAPKNLVIKRVVNSMNPFNWIKVGNIIAKQKYDVVIPKFWLPFMGISFGKIMQIVRSKSPKTTIIALVHNMVPHESRMGDAIFSRYFVKQADAFLAMSQTVYDDVKRYSPTKPIALSPHPVYDSFGDIEKREVAIQKLGLDPSKQYMLFFGLIRDYKGLDLLIQAFADQRFRDTNVKLLIAGEYYASKEKYEALIQHHDLKDDIEQISKYIPDDEVADFFNASDLVVQPYKTATQSGVTQIAYHFNKPMIVTDVGGLREMCPDEIVGYVVPPEPIKIADAILRFYNDTDRDVMHANIVKEKKKYGWDILTNNLLKLAENVHKS